MPAVKTVVAIVNQKGGVGKSTTAINLAAYLADKGERVLVADMDPQGNATSGLGVEPDSGRCMYDVLLEGTPLQDVAVGTRIEGLDVAPATINLVGAEVELVSSPTPPTSPSSSSSTSASCASSSPRTPITSIAAPASAPSSWPSCTATASSCVAWAASGCTPARR